MASITVTDVGNGAVQIYVETPSAGSWLLYRNPASGTRRLVRGFPITSTSDAFVAYDLEAPSGVDVFYEVAEPDGDVILTSTEVNVVSTADGFLRDPLNPSRDIALSVDCPSSNSGCVVPKTGVFFQGFGDVGYASATGVFDLDGGVYPISVAQARRGEVGTIVLVSLSHDDIIALEIILADGTDLVLELDTALGWGLTTDGLNYVAIGDATAQRVSRDMRKPYRIWQLPYRITNGPIEAPLMSLSRLSTGSNGVVPTGFTNDDLLDQGLTHDDVLALGVTHLETMQGDI